MNYQQFTQNTSFGLINSMQSSMLCSMYENAYCRVVTDLLTEGKDAMQVIAEYPGLLYVVHHHINCNRILMDVTEALYMTISAVISGEKEAECAVSVADLVTMYQNEVYPESCDNIKMLKSIAAGLLTPQQQKEVDKRMSEFLGTSYAEVSSALAGAVVVLSEEKFEAIKSVLLEAAAQQAETAVKH